MGEHSMLEKSRVKVGLVFVVHSLFVKNIVCLNKVWLILHLKIGHPLKRVRNLIWAITYRIKSFLLQFGILPRRLI
jgi:hypothetical protein